MQRVAGATESANASPRAVLRNVTYSLLSFVVSAGAGLFLTPLLLARLGASGYGLWALALAFVSYVGLAELGIGAATWKEVATAEAREDERRISVVLSSSRLIFAGVAILGCVIMTGIILALPRFIHGFPSEGLAQLRNALAILAV